MAQLRRLAVLYSELAGYTVACLRALKDQCRTELLVYRWPPATVAPFEEELFGWIDELHTTSGQTSAEIDNEVQAFGPDALLMAGWMDRTYLEVAQRARQRSIPVIAGADTQWIGSLRQRLASWLAPRYLHRSIDVLWVPGERQRQLASSLGYRGTRCWTGIYACDWERFASVAGSHNPASPCAFLYVGRYAEVKGIDSLIAAYRHYRTLVPHPWPLICAGTGPLQHLLSREDGVIDRGFVQPDQLPTLMQEAAAFILPSRREPWGVVVQEAAAAGLPLLCSEASGAAVHLLQDGYNGFRFLPEDTEYLAHCMARMSQTTPDARAIMGQRSFELSKQFTPQRWAETLVDGVARLKREQGVR